ncbi:MAG: alpha/beta hydrolase, partial [Candidatus Xenobia bacterium]
LFNPWVAPDRIPVPKFQLGNFNSLLSLNASPVSTGEAFLHRPAFASAMLQNARDVWVWLPPSYVTDPERRYRTLYFLDGNEAMTRTFPHDALRAAVAAGEAEDVILVFVGFASQNDRIYEFSDPIGRDRFAQFFVQELVPYLDRQFRTRADAAGRGIAGVSLGGNFAYYLARTWPDVFGQAAGQGTAWGWRDWDIVRLYQGKPKAALRLYMDGALAAWDGGPEDSGEASRAAAEAFRSLGYSVTHVEHVGEEHDWPSWAARMPKLVRWFAGTPRPARRPRGVEKV